MKPTAFDSLHPGIALAYFAVALGLAMAAPHPTLLAISFAIAIACGVWLRGGRAVAKSFSWQLPLLVVIVAVNPLFSSTGTTELFRIGTQAVYAEGYANAATMALLFLCVLQWFANASMVLSSDKVMGALGSVLPTIGLMISMVMRLIPRFVRRGRSINAALGACTAARTPQGNAAGNKVASQSLTASRNPSAAPKAAKRPTQTRFADQLRLSTTLMGWSMEDSLETADSMRCRGWGARSKRTTFRRTRFRAYDGIVLTVFLLAFAGAAAAAYTLMRGFGFFPAFHGSLANPLVGLYALVLCFPFLLELIGKVRR